LICEGLLKVLITGGAGFIGANLAKALIEAGHYVTALDDLSTGYRSNLEHLAPAAELVVGSLLDAAAVNSVIDGTGAVVHLGARPSVPRSIADPVASNDVNVNGTINVLEACRAQKNPPYVVFASSSSVYGSNPVMPKHEDLATRPRSPYASSKLAGESYVLSYASSFDLKVLPFRFFNVYGPLQAAGHAYAAVIPAFVSAALNNQPLPIHGDGTQTRDFTHVSTVASVIAAAIAGQITTEIPINLAFGTRTSLLSVVDLLASILDRPLERSHQASRHGDVKDSQADNSRLLALFPGVTPVSLLEGLQSCVDWMRCNQ
jgi:UDP-glucose 4-epimerase